MSYLLYPFAVGVEEIHELISINLFRGSEENHFVNLRNPVQKLSKVRPRSHEHLIVNLLENHRERKGRVLQFLKAAMHQCFILLKKTPI